MLKYIARFLCTERRGNVAITFALVAIPILFGLGASLDYGYAVKARARLNAAADAAALATVTPQMMAQSTAVAQTAAINFFNAQAAQVPRVTYTLSPNPPVVKDVLQNNQRVRTTTLSYTATSTNIFSTLLNMPTIAIGGKSTASASTSPNIDFYLMLDTSPSMAIPATQDGITAMVAATPYQGGGCAFACHETNPAQESSGGTKQKPVFGNQGCPDDPKGRAAPCLDNYALAKNMSPALVLRMDLVQQAVGNLLSTAQGTASATGAKYRIAGYTFDQAVNQPIALDYPQNISQSEVNAIQLMTVPYENTYLGPKNTVVSNSDEDTNFDSAFQTVTSAMAAAGAGNGTNTVGDKPQQVLMLVTDGVSDEAPSGSRIYLPLGSATTLSSQANSTCATIKQNSNVRIAVLYLTYNPLPSNSWYNTYVAPEQSDIALVLQNCASSPSLFFQVNTGGDVSAALNTLFQNAVKGAHLTY